MYYEYFGLNQAPFRITPDTQLFYSGGRRGAVLDALQYAVLSGEGITKVVGEVGSGKTMLARMLAQRLPKSVELVYLANPNLPPEKVLQAIAQEMRLRLKAGADRLYVLQRIQQRLLKKHAENKQVVVFVEEAQSAPLETLEELRLLSNLETEHHKLLQIVLFGQPELDEHLAVPHVRQIKERITNSFYLTALKKREIHDYLLYRLRISGYRDEDIFSANALRLLAYSSKGLMRRINILADKAMLAAYSNNTKCISAKHIWSAVKDSEFRRNKLRWRTALLALTFFACILGITSAGTITWAASKSQVETLLQSLPVPALQQSK